MKAVYSYVRDLWNKERSLCFIWIGVLAYTVFFTTISFLRYEAFSYSDFDFAIFVHECWKILHGSGNISILNNTPIWGNGLELISYLNSLVYFVFNFNPKSLLFLQSFALGASAIPIFLIARRRLYEPLALCLAISYLFYPPIWYANLYEFNPLVLSIFTLLMAFYYLENNRFKWFMVFIILSMINRADLAIVTFMFGVYALFSRKSWRWVLGPSILSVLWLVVGLLILIPKFKNGISFDSYYPQLGKGFSEIIKNAFLHPEIVLKAIATRENLGFLYQILLPVGFFSVLGLKEFLICILSLFQHLISVRWQEHTIFFHYTSTITPFVYISAAYGMARILTNRRVSVFLCALPIILSIFCNFRYGPIAQSHVYTSQLYRDDEDMHKKEILKQIPRDAGVISSFEFSPMLAGRKSYYSFHYVYWGFLWPNVPYKTPEDIDYALINFTDPRLLGFNRPSSDLRIKEFLEKGHFGVVDMFNNVVLFKKGHLSNLKLYEVRPAVKDQDLIKDVVQVKDKFQLKIESVLQNSQENNFLLNFIFRWQAITQLKEEILASIVIVDARGQRVYNDEHIVSYGIYPANRWSAHEEVWEYYNMLIPKFLPVGEYKVYMILFPKGLSTPYPLAKMDGNRHLSEESVNTLITTFSIK